MNSSTIHIQQRSDNDCALASIAMAIGKERWTDLWTHEDLEVVKASKGVSDLEPWLNRAGLVRNVSYRTVYVHGSDSEKVASLLWGRRALVSIASINSELGNHLIYWDGNQVWDPQRGISGKQHVVFLKATSIQVVTLLKDSHGY